MLSQGSPFFHLRCEGEQGIALESLQGSALFLSCRTSCLPTQVGIQPAGDPHRHHDIGSCQSHSGLWMSGILPPVQTRVSRGSCVMSQPGSIVGSCPSRHPIPIPSDIWESRLLSPVSKGDETLKAPPGYNNKIKYGK